MCFSDAVFRRIHNSSNAEKWEILMAEKTNDKNTYGHFYVFHDKKYTQVYIYINSDEVEITNEELNILITSIRKNIVSSMLTENRKINFEVSSLGKYHKEFVNSDFNL
jgi:uncharacterized protein YlbG (UPF0298 family)